MPPILNCACACPEYLLASGSPPDEDREDWKLWSVLALDVEDEDEDEEEEEEEELSSINGDLN